MNTRRTPPTLRTLRTVHTLLLSLLMWGSASVLLTPAFAAEEPPLQSAEIAALARNLLPSLIRVEYQLQYDKGQAPQGVGFGTLCPNCGSIHDNDLEDVVREERPLEIPAYALAPQRIVLVNPGVHPRFIKSITACFGDRRTSATVEAYGLHQNALFLKLEQPLDGVKPLAFKADAPRPYLIASYARLDGAWKVTVLSPSAGIVATEKGQTFAVLPENGLIISRAGDPVGLCLDGELPADDTWKGGPDKWKTLSAAEMDNTIANIRKIAENGILRVELVFRSQKNDGGGGYNPYRSRYNSDDVEDRGDTGTDHNVIGALLDEKTLLVLANLKPKTTARLERILVYTPEGKPVPARFEASFKDDGCFIAKLEKPINGGLTLFGGDILDKRRQPMVLVEMAIQGETRVAYYQPGRFSGFSEGMKNRVFPQSFGSETGAIHFDLDGRLVTLPIATRRAPSSTERQWDESRMEVTPVAYLMAAIADPAANWDPANVPLSEAEENRLAWIGVEMQGLDEELARANNLSEQTANGSIGSIITFVYPDSPAAKAGIEPGAILLRLKVEGRPNPIDVKVESDTGYNANFSWESLDSLSESYFDDLSAPWPSVRNALTDILTEFGPGTKYKAEFLVNGQPVTKDFAVELSPAHFDSAPRFKDEALGLTVRDMTYEVRHYLKKTPGDPGVVISKIEQGGKAAVAGIKPFEVITHVNDNPIANVEEFRKSAGQPGEFRYSVKRMTKGRIVTIRLTEEDIRKAADAAAKKKPKGNAPRDGSSDEKDDKDAPGGGPSGEKKD